MRSVVGLGAVLAGLAGTAQAQEGPSFDCAQAGTVVEEAVCDFADLAWLDGSTAALYAAAGEGLDAAGRERLQAEQAAWLAERDACAGGGDLYVCVHSAYAARLEALAAELPGNPSGVYHYVAGTEQAGSLLLSVLPDGAAGAVISTVVHPWLSLCDVEISGATWSDGGLSWRSSEDIFGDGELCTVKITVDGFTATVTSRNCSGYCGHNAYFDGDYAR
jgi:uncharacterized protein